jgi:hypothetical protein
MNKELPKRNSGMNKLFFMLAVKFSEFTFFIHVGFFGQNPAGNTRKDLDEPLVKVKKMVVK